MAAPDDLAAGVEDRVDTLGAAGEEQEFGQQEACGNVGRRLAYGGRRRRHGPGEIAFMEQTACIAAIGGLRGRV